MSRSVLLQLARNSIEEVLQAQNTIDKKKLIEEHPLLNEKIATEVKIYLNNELRASYISNNNKSLLYNIIIGSKKAAFQDSSSTPITTAEYLSCEIELSLETPDGVIKQRDEALVKEN
jgi:AMMECR1 domain-containing protein